MSLLSSIHPLPSTSSLPQHVAIIMDGNGRWAKRQGVDIIQGHERGAEVLEMVADYCVEKGISYLTVYAFSSENWKRPKAWVNALLGLMNRYLDERASAFHEKGIRARIIGDRSFFNEKTQEKLHRFEDLTRQNTRLNLQLALSYGGRQEIVHAARFIAQAYKEGELTLNNINEEAISQSLYTKDLPDPDLLIRTSGEMRISNFLLWQLAYSEFIFVDCLWPDFTKTHFEKAIQAYTTRERRYGQYLDDSK